MNRCCCCSLETGGLIIGVLEVIGGIIGVIINASMLTAGIVAGQEMDKPNSVLNAKITLSDDDRQQAEIALILYKVSCTVFLIISCIQVLISSVLIHGIRKKSSSLMTIWMIFKVIFIIILVTFSVAACFIGLIPGVLFFLLLIGLSSFYVKVVHDLKNQSSPNHVLHSLDGLPSYMNLNN